MQCRLIHIFFDSFFLDSVFEEFDSIFGTENHYLFYVQDKDYKFRYIKNVGRVTLIHDKKELKRRLYANDYDVLILHGLRLHLPLIAKIPSGIKVVWLPWGFDVYADNKGLRDEPAALRMDLYLEKTREMFFSGPSFYLKNLKEFIRQSRRRHLFLRALARVDFCGPVLSTEYDLLKTNRSFRAEKIQFNYQSDEELVEDPEDIGQIFQGNAVYIGNSASHTSNHLDVLEKLKEIGLAGRKLIVPLSYGNKKYRDVVVKRGKELFGQNYCPLVDFMPFAEYSGLLREVSHAFFAQIRQQAMGNIYMLLAKGVKVYFLRQGIAYAFLKEKGFYVYSMEEDLTPLSLERSLTIEQIIHNRNLIKQLVGRENIQRRLSDSVSKIMQMD